MPLDERTRIGRASQASHAGRGRRGNSLLEVQVAFVVLGIGLAGMCQLVYIQLRQVSALERRLLGQVVQTNAATATTNTIQKAGTYYLVPWQNPWARKLTGAAQIVNGSSSIPCDPQALALPSQPPQAYPVNVIELDAPATSQNVTAYVDVSAP